LARLFERPALVVIDDFEEFLDEASATPPAEFLQLVQELSEKSGPGRLLLISTRSPSLRGLVFERITMLPPSIGDAEAHLSKLLAGANLSQEVAPELMPGVANWLGRNPRAMRSFVACLKDEPLEQLVELSPDQWSLEELSSPMLVRQLEEAFVGKTVGRLGPPDLALLQGLATYRRPYTIEAIRAFRGPTPLEAQLDALRSRFLISRSGSRYSLNPVARRLALSRLKSNPRSWLRAHSRAADFYLPRALQGVTRIDVLPSSHFVEARYHLLNSERISDFQSLAARYRGALLRNYRHARAIPESRTGQEALLETLGSILHDDIRGYPELRALLARLLSSRGGPGDEVAALRQTRLAVRESKDTSVWRLHARLSAAHDTPLALESIGRQALNVLDSAGATQICCTAVEELYLHSDPTRALNLVNAALQSVDVLDRQPLYTVAAFILDRENRRPEALELLTEGYVQIGPQAPNFYRLFEEALFLGLQSRDEAFIERLRLLVHEGPLGANQRGLCDVALLQINRKYREAAELAEQYDEYFTLIAQAIFCWLAASKCTEALRVLETKKLNSSKVASWVRAITYLSNGRTSLYLQSIADCLPERECHDENAWLSVWNSVPHRLSPYPAFYFPLIPSGVTGLERDLYRAHPQTPIEPLREDESMRLAFRRNSELNTEKGQEMTELADQQRFDIGVLTVIPEQTRILRQYLQSQPDFKEWKTRGRRWVMSGTMPFVDTRGADRAINVVSTQTLDQGNQSSSKAYEVLKSEAAFSIVVLTDIAGGLHKDVKLGDVIVANTVIYYDSRAITEKGDSHRGKFYSMSAEVKNSINRFLVLEGEPCLVSSPPAAPGEIGTSFRVHVGPIGSGEAVLKYRDSGIRSWLTSVNSKTLGVEMEAAGVLSADEEEGGDSGTYGALVVRGVSDHADEAKDDSCRVQACQHVLDTLIAMLPALHETLFD
jgi:nucleoside phosphorylase